VNALHKTLSFIIGKPIGQVDHTTLSRQMSAHKQAMRRNQLIHQEARIGSSVLGEVPAGHQREFFCLDKNTWVWSEQWYDQQAKMSRHMNVRYEFQPHGVLKIVDEIPRGYVTGKELKNLVTAIKTYTNRVAVEVYGQAPIAL
jgi:hypothetical protein